jgi:hypothetical protein
MKHQSLRHHIVCYSRIDADGKTTNLVSYMDGKGKLWNMVQQGEDGFYNEWSIRHLLKKNKAKLFDTRNQRQLRTFATGDPGIVLGTASWFEKAGIEVSITPKCSKCKKLKSANSMQVVSRKGKRKSFRDHVLCLMCSQCHDQVFGETNADS